MKSQLSVTLFAITTLVTSTALPAKAGMWDQMGKNPKEFCTDRIGKNTETKVDKESNSKVSHKRDRNFDKQIDTGSRSQLESNRRYKLDKKVRKNKTSGGLKVGPIGGSGSHSETKVGINQRKQHTVDKSRSRHNNSEIYRDSSSELEKQGTTKKEVRKETTTEKVGKNCDALVQTAGQVKSTEIQAETNRKAIESKKDVKMEKIETKAQQQRYQQLMNGW